MKTRTIVTGGQALLVGTALLLSACDGKKAANGPSDAGGRILSRSVTDEMLPYDTVRSRPPSAEMTEEVDRSGDAGGTRSAASSTDSESADETEDAAPAEESTTVESSGEEN